MATRWRVLNRRRRRKAELTQNLYLRARYCDHQWAEEYYGTRWDYYDDHGYSSTDYYDDDGDYECDGDCWHCGGDGYIDGYEDDPIFYAPNEMIRCGSCNGSGQARDMTIW
jgi:hypothetical protein